MALGLIGVTVRGSGTIASGWDLEAYFLASFTNLLGVLLGFQGDLGEVWGWDEEMVCVGG